VGKRGPKPKEYSVLSWSPSFAYAIGLLVTDGSISSDGRHITLVSKDLEQLENFMVALGIKNTIGQTRSGFTGRFTPRIQFGDRGLCVFLNNIGISVNKTLTIGAIDLPDKYFADFLRGHFDGDGSFYSYFDPRWKASYMFYTCFVSASEAHIVWLRTKVSELFGLHGHISASRGKSRKKVYQLKYAKKESLILLDRIYYQDCMHLGRKRLKINKSLSIIGQTI
jgi:hypothetical protein